jgi:hypothetical protein
MLRRRIPHTVVFSQFSIAFIGCEDMARKCAGARFVGRLRRIPRDFLTASPRVKNLRIARGALGLVGAGGSEDGGWTIENGEHDESDWPKARVVT